MLIIFAPMLNMSILIMCKNFGRLCLKVYSSNIYAWCHLDIFTVIFNVGYCDTLGGYKAEFSKEN